MEDASQGIELTGEARPPKGDEEWLVAALRSCAGHLPVPVRRATIAFVRDARMGELHARFSGDPATTDVLTFAQNAPGEPIDCDIAVCVDEAARRAAEFGHQPRAELLLYALHGLLHACGMDDLEPAAHAAMHAEEDRILAAAGIGALYAPRSAHRGGAATDAAPSTQPSPQRRGAAQEEAE